MITKGLLDQLLNSGSSASTSTSSNTQTNIADQLSSLLAGKGTSLLAGGALGLLLGSKSGRKIGGKVLTYGGVAALGYFAYKAFQNYQQKSANAAGNPMKPLEQLPAAEADAHCRVILVALIAASKSDGHIDERERQLIETEMKKFTQDPQLKHWLEQELKKPLDPAEVARHAGNNQAMAAEMYLASLLAVDQQSFMEKSYLDELAKQLKLPDGLRAELAQQVSGVTAHMPK